MEITSSYRVKIRDITKATRQTVKIYREAVTFL